MIDRLGYILAAILLLVTAGLTLSGMLFGDIARNAAFTAQDMRSLNLVMAVVFALEAGFFLLMAIWPGRTSDVISIIFGLSLLMFVGGAWGLAKFVGVHDITRDGAATLPAALLGTIIAVIIFGPVVMAIVRRLRGQGEVWDQGEDWNQEEESSQAVDGRAPNSVAE